MREISIVAHGPVGCGKTAILTEIEITLRAIGVNVRWADPAAIKTDRNGTDPYAVPVWPNVVLVEVGTKPIPPGYFGDPSLSTSRP